MKRLRDLLVDGMLLALPLGVAVQLLSSVFAQLKKLLVPVAQLLPAGHFRRIAAIVIAAILVLLLALVALARRTGQWRHEINDAAGVRLAAVGRNTIIKVKLKPERFKLNRMKLNWLFGTLLSLAAASASAGVLDPDCTAEKAAKSAATKAVVGVGGRCDPKEAAVDTAKDVANLDEKKPLEDVRDDKDKDKDKDKD